MKNMLAIVALVIAFAMWAFAAPARGIRVQSGVAASSEKASPAIAVAPANHVESEPSIAAEDVVSLTGRSTYALSRVEPFLFAPAATGIDRQRPALQPPIY